MPLMIAMQKIASFIANRRASVALALGLSLLPIAGAASIALDYSTLSNRRTSLNALLDSAALAGVSAASVKTIVNAPNQAAAAKAIVESNFNAQIADKPELQAALKSTTVTTSIVNRVLTTKICYSAEIKTPFMSFLGTAALNLSNCAQATASLPTFVVIHILLDVSASMGIGATAADQILMQNSLGCAFACHTTSWGQPIFAPNCNTKNDPDNRYFSQVPECAKRIGAKIRFDVVREALMDLVDKAVDATKVNLQFRFALYKFSSDWQLIAPQGSTHAFMKNRLLGITMDIGGGGTNLTVALNSTAPHVPVGGDGSSTSSSKVFVLIVTDGLESNIYEKCDVRPKYPGCRYHGAWQNDTDLVLNSPSVRWGDERSQVFNPALCSPLKAKGTVMMLYLPYLKPANSTDGRFDDIQSQLLPTLTTRIRQCASSSNLAFSAASPTEIQAAMDKIFSTIETAAQLKL